MGTAAEYGQWYYLIYWVPGGVALLLLLLSSLGGGRHHHRTGTGGHARHIGHARAGGVKHQGAKGAGAQSAAFAPSPLQQILAFFGVGSLPGPFVWGSALLGWGLFGFWGTRLWEMSLHHPTLFVLPALGVAVLGALGAARLTAALGTRLMPQDASSAVSTVELCGRTGTVTYPVDQARGRVHVYDVWGTLHDVQARLAPDQTPIVRGREVLVTDYDAVQDRVIVEEIG